MPANRKYGWRPDHKDPRDHKYSLVHPTIAALPIKIDLRSQCPPVWDQRSIGSCTAHAVGGQLAFLHIHDKLPAFDPSRLFIYYNSRALEGTVNQDAGAMIRNAIKSVVSSGCCDQATWPYVEAKFTVRPSSKAFAEAKQHVAIQYQRLNQTSVELRSALAKGHPFVGGFQVYESFESTTVASTGIAPMPRAGEQILGGHAVQFVGYNDTTQRFVVRNSWGTAWGQKGYFTLPYNYILNPNLASDFWTIQAAT